MFVFSHEHILDESPSAIIVLTLVTIFTGTFLTAITSSIYPFPTQQVEGPAKNLNSATNLGIHLLKPFLEALFIALEKT